MVVQGSLSLRFSASSPGTPVRGLTSRAESNGPVGFLNRSLSVLSACSASPLTHEARLAESSNDSESIFRSRDGEAPKRKRPRGARMRLRTSDWEASVKAQVHRPQPKARSPRELCPSAALRRVVPEEPLFGRDAAGGRSTVSSRSNREARGAPKPTA